MTEEKVVPSKHRCGLSDVIGWGLETLACNVCGRTWLRQQETLTRAKYSCNIGYPSREDVKPPAQVIGAQGFVNDSVVKGF